MLMGGGYRVSRVSLEGSGRTLEGRGGSLVAMTNARPNPLQLQPPGTLNAVLEIKCIGSHIQNLGVGAAYNGTCTCPSFSLLRGVSLTSGAVSDTAAVHWYSNDPSIWYVGFNKITSEIVMLSRFATLFRLATAVALKASLLQTSK